MKPASKAAEGRRKIWQGHDKRDSKLVRDGAEKLYSVLSDSSEEELEKAGKMIKDSFWMADEAEKYMEEDNPAREGKMYDRATRLLKEARDQVSLPYSSMDCRGNGWWMAYRRGDNNRVEREVQAEHEEDLGDIMAARESTENLLEAFKAHDRDNWDEVEENLEEYYEVFLHHFDD